MPANQLITKPREEADLTLTVTDGDVVKDYYDVKTSLDYSVKDLLGG